MYHGTEISRGKKILKDKKMKYSLGDGEWLGDGIYLYRDKLYAYRWITIQYKNKYSRQPISNEIFKKYIILKVDIEYNYDKVFSMTNPEHRIVFDKIKLECKKKAELSEKLKKFEYTDGVIINFMFNNMGFAKQYDMVEAVYPISEETGEKDTRFKVMSEYQLCVKNPEIIKNIEDCTKEFDFNYYHKQLKLINSYRTRWRNNSYRNIR